VGDSLELRNHLIAMGISFRDNLKTEDLVSTLKELEERKAKTENLLQKVKGLDLRE
jgi:hypothetical protein